MGQSYSKEVKSFRKKSKKEANALGFLPNKRAVAHPLNRAPESTKDPRSKRQGLWLSVVKMPIHKFRASNQHLVCGLSNTFPSLKWASPQDRKSRYMTSAGLNE